MVSPNDLCADLWVHLRYAGAVGGEHGVDVLRSAFDRGLWKESPQDWLSYLHGIAQRSADASTSLRALLAQVVNALIETGAEGAPAALFQGLVVGEIAEVDNETRKRLVDWFVKSASPSESTVAAEVTRQLSWKRQSPANNELIVTLGKWLLERGSIEFRQPGSQGLVLAVGRALKEVAKDRAQTLQCLSCFARSNPPLEAWPQVEAAKEFLALAEWALDENASVETATQMLLARGGGSASWALSIALRHGEEFPRIGRLGLAALALGEFTDEDSAEIWTVAFGSNAGPAPDLHFRTFAELEVALPVFAKLLLDPPRRGPTSEPTFSPHLSAWAAWLTQETLRIYDGELASAPWATLKNIALYSMIQGRPPEVIAVIGAALRENARKLAEDRATVQMIDETAATPPVVIAALEALARPVARGPTAAPTSKQPIRGVEQLLRRTWPAKVCGIEPVRLLGGLTRARLENLGDDKVGTDGDTLQIDARGLEEALNGPWNVREQDALACLFVVHEWIHHRQGIGRKERITNLRFVGGETALMHFDLGADNVAARLTAEVLPGWSVVDLKDLQGRSLIAYPAGKFHSLAARNRKAQRLLGLRLEVHARRAGVEFAPWSEEGYAFAEFGAGGGEFLMLHSGPPFRAWGSARIEAKEAAVLTKPLGREGAQAQLDEIDSVLKHLIASGRQTAR